MTDLNTLFLTRGAEIDEAAAPLTAGLRTAMFALVPTVSLLPMMGINLRYAGPFWVGLAAGIEVSAMAALITVILAIHRVRRRAALNLPFDRQI